MKHILFLAGALLAGSSGAQAAELFGGVYAHDVDTPLTKGGFEDGADIQLGWRGDRIGLLRVIGAPSPHAFASISSASDTDFVAAGLSWKIGHRFYLRPGIGLAIHDRDSRVVRDGRRLDLGSRILFEPEIAVGYQVSERFSVDASWVHLSHAQLFSGQNPGMDSFGLRLNYRLP